MSARHPFDAERNTGETPTQAGLFAVPTDELDFVRESTWSPGFRGAISRHYTDSDGAPPGKKIGWRITEGGNTLGFIGLGEPSFKLAPRRRLVGRTDDEALLLGGAYPLERTVSCFIYRLEGPHRATASAILRAWHPVAAAEWLSRFGWEPLHWETMVGQGVEGNLGCCFKAAGYRTLGLTTGRTARRPAGSSHDAPRVWGDSTPKLVLYRGPLARHPRKP